MPDTPEARARQKTEDLQAALGQFSLIASDPHAKEKT